MIHATVIVCTYNRAESLRKTLTALSQLHAPDGTRWEVVVVDNNSGDHTQKVVESCVSRFDCLRYEFESQQGLSHARNRGLQVARGEVILFTDDDVCPYPDWLERILVNMSAYQCDACGGYIEPSWEATPPAWLTERFYGFLAIKTDEDGPCNIADTGTLPFGANMAFRRSVFMQVGEFDTSRGRKGAVLASGEDGEMFERMLAAGMTVMYFPDARVRHSIEAFRTRKSYFRRWRYQTSYNLAQTRGMAGRRCVLGIPLYVFPQLLRASGRALVARFTAPGDEAFNREIIVWHFLGTIYGLFQANWNQRHAE